MEFERMRPKQSPFCPGNTKLRWAALRQGNCAVIAYWNTFQRDHVHFGLGLRVEILLIVGSGSKLPIKMCMDLLKDSTLGMYSKSVSASITQIFSSPMPILERCPSWIVNARVPGRDSNVCISTSPPPIVVSDKSGAVGCGI